MKSHKQETIEIVSRMSSRQEIEKFIQDTNNTSERLWAWQYLQSL